MMLSPVALACASLAAVAPLKPDADTSCLVEVRGGKAVDATRRGANATLASDGVEVVPDATFGDVLRFVGGPTGVVVPDEGRIGFSRGLTIEAYVMLETNLTRDVSFARKSGTSWQHWSFDTSLARDNRFSLGLLGFEGEAIDFTEDEKPHRWGFRPDASYGGRGGLSNGNTPIPVGEWTHVAFTYDPSRALCRLWVNGSIDREYFRPHTLTRTPCDDDDVPVVIGAKAKGFRLAQLRISTRPRDLGWSDPVRVFIHENAYRGEGYVHIQPVRDDLPVPVEVEVMNSHVPFMCKVTRAVLASATKPVNVAIPKHAFACAKSDLVVKLKKDGREIWRQEALIQNPTPITAAMSKFYRGEGPYDASARPDWVIGKDNTFAYRGRPVFPLMLYFARPDCFDEVADLGFNMLMMRRPKGMLNGAWRKTLEPFYVKAASRGITLTADEDVEGRPGQGFVFLHDEPFGYNFNRCRDAFMDARAGRKHPTTLPIVATQNNAMRYRETSMCCDVLAPDPYNKGREPLRSIYDSIRAACADVDHLKPVMCLVGNYGTDRFRPDAEELRTMCYLAIEAGATALGFYSWDEGEVPGGPTDTSTKPAQKAAYKGLFAEFRALEPALTTANVGVPRIEPATPRGFFSCVKKGRDGKVYLFVSSDLYRTSTRRIVIPSAAGRKATLLFGPVRDGARPATPDVRFGGDGAAEFLLPPVSSAVYRIE